MMNFIAGCGGPDTAVGAGQGASSATSTSEDSETQHDETESSTDASTGTPQTTTGNSGDEGSTPLPDLPQDDECELECELGVRPQQLSTDLGRVCEQFINVTFCKENKLLTKGEVAHFVYFHLPLETFEGCEQILPPWLDLKTDDTFFKVISGLFCIGVLKAQPEQTRFCAEADACQDWWQDVLKEVPKLP